MIFAVGGVILYRAWKFDGWLRECKGGTDWERQTVKRMERNCKKQDPYLLSAVMSLASLEYFQDHFRQIIELATEF